MAEMGSTQCNANFDDDDDDDSGYDTDFAEQDALQHGVDDENGDYFMTEEEHRLRQIEATEEDDAGTGNCTEPTGKKALHSGKLSYGRRAFTRIALFFILWFLHPELERDADPCLEKSYQGGKCEQSAISGDNPDSVG